MTGRRFRKLAKEVCNADDPKVATAIELAADTIDDIRALRSTLRKAGWVTTDRFQQIKPHPAIGALADASDRLYKHLGFIGLVRVDDRSVADDRPVAKDSLRQLREEMFTSICELEDSFVSAVTDGEMEKVRQGIAAEKARIEELLGTSPDEPAADDVEDGGNGVGCGAVGPGGKNPTKAASGLPASTPEAVVQSRKKRRSTGDRSRRKPRRQTPS